MSHPHGALIRELAHALSVALGPVLTQAHSPQAVRAAIDTAQVLGLAGLDRVLQSLLPHALHPWPATALPTLTRVQELAAACVAAGSIVPIQSADAELTKLAIEIERRGGGIVPAEDAPGDVPTLSLAEVLEDLPLADEASRARAGRVRVGAPVAAALRAALDWLEEDGAPPRPLEIAAEESLVDMVVSRVNVAGLKAAEKVLSVVGGVLYPTSVLGKGVAPAGSWIVRVPSVRGRDSHLMLVQGGVPLALPWHAVLRLYMVPAIELEGGMVGLGSPVLPPLRPLARTRGEHPVALVGHGLKRAYLVADELVWRLEAEACATDETPPAGVLSRAVKTEDGTLYWLLDPAVALGVVEPPPALPDERVRSADAALPVLRRDEVEPLDGEEPAARAASVESATLEPAAAGARAEEAPEVEATQETTPGESAGPRLVTHAPPPRPPVLPAGGARRALVAEDSLAARVFLTRMLERQGYVVRAAISATELFDELVDDSWSLVCVDVELPDARGEDVLARVVAGVSGRDHSPPIVALVRDAADVAVALAAGVTKTLRKPFEAGTLHALLAEIELDLGNPS